VSNLANTKQVDVIVLGAGFGGALTAMVAFQKGCSVLLIEKGQHPRMMIGESTTPLTNLLMEEIACDFNLPFLQDFTQWGKWKTTHPTMRVGLKRGFSFYNHQQKAFSSHRTEWDRELLVAASPNDTLADTQWWREDWDAYLVDQCKKLGIEYWDNTETIGLNEASDGITLRLKNSCNEMKVKGRLLVDACGGGMGVAKLLNIQKKPLKHTPDTFAVYTHFNNVEPCEPPNPKHLPYPPEQAAIHHLIDGGWIWSLRFDHGPVSAGAVLTDGHYHSIKDQAPASIWSKLVKKYPSINRFFKNATPMYPMRKIDRVGFQMERTHGNRWIMLPSSAGFVDPLLSTGFPITLQGIQRLGDFISPQALNELRPISNLKTLANASLTELDISDQMIGTLYETMDEFRHFAATTLLYFASVSFTETARRLKRKHLAPGFLFSERKELSDHLISTLMKIQDIHHNHQTKEEKWSALRSLIDQAIDPINVIGLRAESCSPYFSAESTPLMNNADKLEVSSLEIKNMLIRLGLAPN
jgi:tetracycline 7-halogenase / FADH2 O2-dependent halogenase